MQPISFLHAADLHLGSYQNKKNMKERFRDFNRTFKRVLDLAFEEKVDFVLISGDFFEYNNVAPETMLAVHYIITRFKKSCIEVLRREIPIIAIEGNHDIKAYDSDRSWMRVLAGMGLIILLNGTFKDTENGTELVFEPWSHEKKSGGYIDIKGVRVHGMGYAGSTVEQLFPHIYNAIENSDDRFNVLMMHFGIRGMVAREEGIDVSSNELQRLHEKVDYLALGHFHRRYILPTTGEYWIFNPGSTELIPNREYFKTIAQGKEQYERGVFIVEVHGKNTFSLRRIYTFVNGEEENEGELSNRRFITIDIYLPEKKHVTFNETMEFILKNDQLGLIPDRVDGKVKKPSDPDKPVVLLRINGTVSYESHEFNSNKLVEEIMRLKDVLFVRIYSFVKSSLDGLQVETDKSMPIEDIELGVFASLAKDNEEYRNHYKEIAEFMQELKQDFTRIKADPPVLKEKIKTWWRANIAQEKTGKQA